MSDTVPVAVQWEYDRNHMRRHIGCGGLVTLHQGQRPGCQACGTIDDNAGWLKRLLMWNWHWTSLDGWPGWDIVGEGSTRHPPFVGLTIRKGHDKPSLDISREWDDLATGLFYNHDWTEDGLPYVHDGETYRAGFWFEKTADRDAFVARYGGTPS